MIRDILESKTIVGVKETFRQRLDKKMNELQKTGATLSREIGIKPATTYKYRDGSVIPSLEVLTRIASSLNCSTDYLLGLVDEDNLPVPTEQGLSTIEREVLAIFKNQSLEEQQRLLALLRIAVR